MFGTPTLDHRVTCEYLQSSLQTEWALTAAGIARGHIVLPGDCFVAKVRNRIVTDFLRDYPMATDLFFLDDDISWPAAKVIEFLNRPEDVVAGIYPKKSETPDFPVMLEVDAGTGALIERDGLAKAIWAPTGFMRIKRRVLESMAYKAEMFKDSHVDGNPHEYFNIFEAGIDGDGWFCGEDVWFCRKLALAGFEVWIDPDIPFKHRGNKSWNANLSDFMPMLRARAAEAAKTSQAA